MTDLLPTPRATDGTHGGPNQRGSRGDLMLPSAIQTLLPTPMNRDHKGYGPADLNRNDPNLSALALLLPTPGAYDADRGGPQDPEKRRAGGHQPTLNDVTTHLLPTPAVNDMGAAYTPETWDQWTATMRAKHGNGNGHGDSLNIEVQRVASESWGKYAAAIHRQEAAFGRPAPPPTDTRTSCPLDTKDGDKPRLSCAFDEWLMGLPAGWITDVPGITHNDVLRICGNGVVWQQAATAIRSMLLRMTTQAGAA